MILKELVPISTEVLKVFRQVYATRDPEFLLAPNYRPAQAGNGRRIYDGQTQSWAVLDSYLAPGVSIVDSSERRRKRNIAIGATMSAVLVLLGVILVVMRYLK